MNFAVKNLTDHLKSCRNRYMVMASNMANSGTDGFKKNVVVQKGMFMGTVVDTSQGVLAKTGNPLDLAITGGGFFVVRTERGDRFTSCGSFTLDEKQRLVTKRGEPVLNDAGKPITIRGDLEIAEDGSVYSGKEKVARLAVVKPENRYNMISEQESFLRFNPTLALKGEFTIKSGYLEKSNVDPLREMTAGIEMLRDFELAQRILKINQTLAEKSAAEIGNTSR
ncbi:MAG: flagellar hook basal-body protein [Candidatus Eremiobacteraeota bacterium]|nr:flagellar hook basal-body protein [Candidatus Eremiobacteraeota bacterium]